MDDNSRSDNNPQRRHNAPPMHPTSDPRYAQALHQPSQQQSRSYGASSTDRFRPGPLNNPPGSATGRGVAAPAGYSTGYYQEPTASAFPTTAMAHGAMGYHQQPAEYGQADTRQTQGFGGGAYNPMMYNVQGAAGAQNPAVYDTSQQFSSRQPAALQMMPSDVGTSYFQSEPTNTAAAASGMQPSASSASQPVYQQPGLSSYSGGMASMGDIAAQPATAADISMEEQEGSESTGLEEAWATYQTELRGVFRNIQSGVLAAASESLLNVSDWLLSHVADLGLNTDNQSLHQDRIKLWDDFNHAWLAMFQRQKDMMESESQLQPSQTLISREGLEKMGKELVRLCDGIERHGLVDYQYGVWEEQIIDILGECLDLYETPSNYRGPEAAASPHRG